MGAGLWLGPPSSAGFLRSTVVPPASATVSVAEASAAHRREGGGGGGGGGDGRGGRGAGDSREAGAVAMVRSTLDATRPKPRTLPQGSPEKTYTGGSGKGRVVEDEGEEESLVMSSTDNSSPSQSSRSWTFPAYE